MPMSSDPRQNNVQELKYHAFGWILFLICAVLFIASSIRNQDTMALIGSVLFLLACFAFLIPLVRNLRQDDGDSGSA